MRMTQSRFIGLALAGALLAGCGHGGAALTFAGVRNPILLGSKDRIGQKGDSAPAAKVKEFDAEAGEWSIRVSDSRKASGSTTNKGKVAESKWMDAASEAVAGDGRLNINIRTLNAGGWAVWFGLMDSSWVSVEGDVVQAVQSGEK